MLHTKTNIFPLRETPPICKIRSPFNPLYLVYIYLKELYSSPKLLQHAKRVNSEVQEVFPELERTPPARDGSYTSGTASEQFLEASLKDVNLVQYLCHIRAETYSFHRE